MSPSATSADDALSRLRDIRDEQLRLAWRGYDEAVETLGLCCEHDDLLSMGEQRLMLEAAREALLERSLRRGDAWLRCECLAGAFSYEDWRHEVATTCFDAPKALRGAEERSLRWLDEPLRRLHEALRRETSDESSQS